MEASYSGLLFYDAQTDRQQLCMSTQVTTHSFQRGQTFLHVCICIFYRHEMKRLYVDMTQNFIKKVQNVALIIRPKE